MAVYCLLGFATLTNIIALLLVAVSFSTDHWINISVNRIEVKQVALTTGSTTLNRSLSSDPNYFSRSRGLFRTCYEGNETKFLDSLDPDTVVENTCVIEQGYELKNRVESLDWKNDNNYDSRIHLMRTHFGMFVLSMLLLLIAIFCGAFGCWRDATSGLRAASLLCFFGMFTAALGIAMFHGYKYLEDKKLNYKPFRFFWENDLTLAEHSNVELGYSYILGWLGAAAAMLGAILYLWSALQLKDKKHAEDNAQERAEKEVIREQLEQQAQYAAQPPAVMMTVPPSYPSYAGSPVYQQPIQYAYNQY